MHNKRNLPRLFTVIALYSCATHAHSYIHIYIYQGCEVISLKHVWSVAGCLYSSLAMHACGCLSADAPAFAD